MSNLESPYHYLVARQLAGLYGARYYGTHERLLNSDPEATPAFTGLLQHALSEVKVCVEMVEMPDGLRAVVPISEVMDETLGRSIDLGRTMRSIGSLERQAVGASRLTPVERDLRIVTSMDAVLRQVPTPIRADEQSQWLVNLGLVAACNKPPNHRVQSALKGKARTRSAEDAVFREAVRSLERRRLDPAEEAKLEEELDKFKEQLRIKRLVERAAHRLNRYYQGRLVSLVLAGLMDDATTRQNTLDEIAVTLGKAPIPLASESPLGYSLPSITVPWPILPPGQGTPRTGDANGETTGPETGDSRGHQLDPLRTQWIGMLALSWPFGGVAVEVDLHNAGQAGRHNKYEGVLLNGPDREPFALLADTAVVGRNNALFAGIVGKLQNRRDRPVHWRVVFRGTKGQAIEFGARRFYHTGQDFHVRVLEYLRTAFVEQFGYSLPLE